MSLELAWISAAKVFRTISDSQMGSQLLQNTQKKSNKLTYYLEKSEEKMDLSHIYLAAISNQTKLKNQTIANTTC